MQVIQTSGDGRERKNAASVLSLLKKGKHWVLVTLLLSNVITNETLPIVLDRSLGGGWPAVLGSTVLIGTVIACRLFFLHGAFIELTVIFPSLQSSLARSSPNRYASATVFPSGLGWLLPS